VNLLRTFSMQLWEWVLCADREHDLADPTAAAAWFAEFRMQQIPLGIRWDKDRQPWSRPVAKQWREAVYSLRSLANRLRNRKTRPTPIGPCEADRVFERYVRGLTLVIRRSDDEYRRGRQGEPEFVRVPLRASTFRGVSINPGIMSAHDHPDLDRYWAGVAMVMDGYWRLTFGSLAVDQIPPVCTGCGQPLAKTPGGRTPRANRCKKCRFKEWYARQPKTKLRKRWRDNKAAERARQHQGEE
jgi:hypothetical protein